jgi:hypothetical protein
VPPFAPPLNPPAKDVAAPPTYIASVSNGVTGITALTRPARALTRSASGPSKSDHLNACHAPRHFHVCHRRTSCHTVLPFTLIKPANGFPPLWGAWNRNNTR